MTAPVHCSYNAAMTVQPFMPWFAADTYMQRRRALCARLAERGVTSGKVLLIANVESPRNYPANCYPFRQDSSWLYFMGLGVPGHAAV
ncbi:MAG: aminopeptidase P N-terminal domain-containing protein, partial [Rectinemataceae bacterium]